KIGGNRFRDLDGCELDASLSERVPGQRRNSDAAGLLAVEKRLHLAVPFHPVGKTGPTRALAWAENRPYQGINAGGLQKQPGWLVGEVLLIQFRQAALQIIAHQRDRQIRRTLRYANTQPA